jgi:uncharacterized delta-60 repeat protein
MHRMLKFGALTAIVLVAGTWTVTQGQTGGDPGTLDTSFGTGGVATAPNLSGTFDHIAVQRFSNGEERVVALKSQVEWTMARFLGNGALDTTFGTGGIVQRTSGLGTVYAWGGIVAQPDNKLVAVGHVPTSKDTLALAVCRYMPNGQYDTSFGKGGTTFLPYLSLAQDDEVTILDTDGRILVAGHVSRGNGTYDTQVIRLNAAGVLDASFGSGGVATLAGAGMAGSLALQRVQIADGVAEERIVVATSVPHGSGPTPPTWTASLRRLTAGGSLDDSFGELSGGVVDVAVPGARDTILQHVVIDGSNRVVAVGLFRLSGGTENDILAVRYLENGTPDPDFADHGTLRQDWLVGHHTLSRVAVHPNGTILAAGYTYASTYTLTTWRFTDSGAPDVSFGVNGMVTTAMRVGSPGDLAFVRGSTRFVVGFGTSVGAKGRLKLIPAVGRFLY